MPQSILIELIYSHADRLGLLYNLLDERQRGQLVLVEVSNVNGVKVTTITRCDSSGNPIPDGILASINTDDSEEALKKLGYPKK
jgi:hypothetical protein